MVLLTLFDVVPVAVAVLMAALAAVFTRTLSMDDAYRSISWSSVVLVAAPPLASAHHGMMPSIPRGLGR